MGMPEVLSLFRRQGMGSLMLARLCAHQLSQGLIPFSQFAVDNIASAIWGLKYRQVITG